MSAVFEGGVLGVGAEVPGVVGGVGAAEVEVPVGVDAGWVGGGAAVGGGFAEFVREFAAGVGHRSVGFVAVLPGAEGVPIAVGEGAGIAADVPVVCGQAADGAAVGTGLAGSYGADGVAGGDGAGATAAGRMAAGDAGGAEQGRVAVGDRAVFDADVGVGGGNGAEVSADQPAHHLKPLDFAALDIGGDNAAGVVAGQGADMKESGNIHIHQGYLLHGSAGEVAEQADIVAAGGRARGINVQVGDGVAVAVESGREPLIGSRRRREGA